MSRCRGNVVWFNNTMGFGFLRRESGPDVFCHRAALQAEDPRRFRDGAEVEFDVTGPGGCHADNVVLLKA